MRPGASTICRIERAVTLLPLPLSPTMRSVSPRRTVNETSSTAFSTPWRKGKVRAQIAHFEHRRAVDGDCVGHLL